MVAPLVAQVRVTVTGVFPPEGEMIGVATTVPGVGVAVTVGVGVAVGAAPVLATIEKGRPT